MYRSLAILGIFCAASLALPHAAAAGDRAPQPVAARSSEICLGPAVGVQGLQTPLAPEEDVLWCTTADDPRCAPATGGSGSSSLVLDHTSAAPSGALERVAPSPSAALDFAALRGEPHPGFRSRLDRPPRR